LPPLQILNKLNVFLGEVVAVLKYEFFGLGLWFFLGYA
jgi:hypothetical protein